MGVILLNEPTPEPAQETAALPPTYLKPLVDKINAMPDKSIIKLAHRLQVQAGAEGIVLGEYHGKLRLFAARMQVLLGTLQEVGVVLEAAFNLSIQSIAAKGQQGIHSPVKLNMRNINPPQQEAINALLALGLPVESVTYLSGPPEGAEESHG